MHLPRSLFDVNDLSDQAVRAILARAGERFYATRARLSVMDPSAAVLCALPRTGDIDPDADGDPRSHYFRQSAEGLFVRMALMEAYATRVAL